VEMDITQGLPENLEIEWRGRRRIQSLDYLGVPFRCSICRTFKMSLQRRCGNELNQRSPSQII
jgi:hypothetical protein